MQLALIAASIGRLRYRAGSLSSNALCFTRIVLFVLGFLVLGQVARASDGAGFSHAQLAEAERLVYAMGAPESIGIPTRRLLQKISETDPEGAKALARIVEPLLAKEYIARELREVFAEGLDIDACRRLAEFWEGPAGRRLVRTQVQVLSTGSAPKLQFTRAEQDIIARFERNGAARDLERVMPAFEKRLAEFQAETLQLIRQRYAEEVARQRK